MMVLTRQGGKKGMTAGDEKRLGGGGGVWERDEGSRHRQSL